MVRGLTCIPLHIGRRISRAPSRKIVGVLTWERVCIVDAEMVMIGADDNGLSFAAEFLTKLALYNLRDMSNRRLAIK